MYRAYSQVSVKASPSHVYSLLKEIEKFPQFMRHVREISVQNISIQEKLVDWKIDIEGTEISWRERDIYLDQFLEINFSLLEGDYGAYFGKWKVDEVESTSGRSKISLTVYIDWNIPSFEKVLNDVLLAKSRKIIRGMLAAIKVHAEKKFQPTFQDQQSSSNADSKLMIGKMEETTETHRQFAFVIHPLDMGLVSVAFKEPHLINRKQTLLKKAFEWLPSFKCSDVTGIESTKMVPVRGQLMYLSLLPEQILSLDTDFVIRKLVEAGKVAKENGAKILGLGAYAAHVGRNGVLIERELGMPVTTGTHYTIHIAISSLEEVANRVGLDLAQCRVAIVGATGAIGRICAEYFFGKVAELLIVSRNIARANQLRRDYENGASSKITVESDVKSALRKADIAIMATTTPTALADLMDLRPGILVCDISRPRNISNVTNSYRDDVILIDGGVVAVPGQNVDFNFYFGLPKGLAYACMAETIILTLEDKYESYSLGGRVSFDKVRKIGALGEKHGFRVAKIMSFEKEVHQKNYDTVSKLVLGNKVCI